MQACNREHVLKVSIDCLSEGHAWDELKHTRYGGWYCSATAEVGLISCGVGGDPYQALEQFRCCDRFIVGAVEVLPAETGIWNRIKGVTLTVWIKPAIPWVFVTAVGY
jgi:hypothetical protein